MMKWNASCLIFHNVLLKAYAIDSLYIRVINLHIVIFFTLHWISCLHYLVADLFNPVDKRKEYSWVTLLELWDAPVWRKYINAMIRALSNMVFIKIITKLSYRMHFSHKFFYQNHFYAFFYRFTRPV